MCTGDAAKFPVVKATYIPYIIERYFISKASERPQDTWGSAASEI